MHQQLDETIKLIKNHTFQKETFSFLFKHLLMIGYAVLIKLN